MEAAGETAAGDVEVFAEAAGEVEVLAEAAGEVEVFAETAGEVLVVAVEVLAGEVDVVDVDEPQPAKAATSIREANTTAIVFFMGFPPKF